MESESLRLLFRFPRVSCAFASAPKEMEVTSSKVSGQVSVSVSVLVSDCKRVTKFCLIGVVYDRRNYFLRVRTQFQLDSFDTAAAGTPRPRTTRRMGDHLRNQAFRNRIPAVLS